MKGLTPDEITTVNAYNKHAVAWNSTHDDKDFYTKEYRIFKALLTQGSVLEIGCGTGRDALKLIELGYNYLGTDVAKDLLKSAQKRAPDASFQHIDIYSMDYSEKFDGFWCAAVVLHIPKNRLLEALLAMNKQIRLGGIGFISTKQGTSNTLEPLPYDSSSQRLQVHYSKEEFDVALSEAGFNIIEYTFRPLSERAKWMCYFVQKRT